MAKAAAKKEPMQKRQLYGEDGKVKDHKSCPKCGPGVFLANHKDRLSCGKCGYTEKKE